MDEETLKRIASALETIAEESKKTNTNLTEIIQKLDWIDASVGDNGIDRTLGGVYDALDQIRRVRA